MTALDDHLGAVLKAHWRGRVAARQPAINALAAALAANAAMMAAAKAKRAALEELDAKCNGQLDRRDAIGAVHLRALRAALAQLPAKGTTDG